MPRGPAAGGDFVRPKQRRLIQRDRSKARQAEAEAEDEEDEEEAVPKAKAQRQSDPVGLQC